MISVYDHIYAVINKLQSVSDILRKSIADNEKMVETLGLETRLPIEYLKGQLEANERAIMLINRDVINAPN